MTSSQIIIWLLSALGAVVSVATFLFWRLWLSLATKEDLERVKQAVQAEDRANDAEMERRLQAEIAMSRAQVIELHNANIGSFREIREDIREVRSDVRAILGKNHGGG